MKLSNKTYEILKWTVMIVLPALASLYSDLSGLWGFPYSTQIPATIMHIATFIGVCVGISTFNYKKTNQTQVLNGDLLAEIAAYQENPEAFAANFMEDDEEAEEAKEEDE